MRTLVVGIDAGCFSVIDPLLDGGDLPTFERLIDEGVAGELTSQIPPWTASAWPSLYTGMNPGKHGIFDFLRFDGYDWDIVNASHVAQRTLWEYADFHDETSVVVNAPVSHPPTPIDGAVVPGYLAPEGAEGHPEGIVSELDQELGGYRIYAPRETAERADEAEKFQHYLELTHARGEAFRTLADRFDPTFGFVEFQKTDAVFHDFPGEDDRVSAIYRAVDEELGSILETVDPDTVFVVSDHGIGPYRGFEVKVNQLLKRRGMVTSSTGEAVPSWFQVKDEELTTGSAGRSRSLLQGAAGLAAKVGITHQRAKAILDRLGLSETVSRYVPVSAVFAASETVDFEASQAYVRSPSELGVRLNLEGREPKGVIPADEAETARAEVIEWLSTLETPDDDQVFETVAPRAEYFWGPEAHRGPDIVTVPADFQHSLSALLGEPFDDPEPMNHKPEGLFIAWGRDVDTSKALPDAHLFDVAPTVLSALGLPPAAGMDGEVLPVVTAEDEMEYPALERGPETGTGDAGVAERLEDLGYLE